MAEQRQKPVNRLPRPVPASGQGGPAGALTPRDIVGILRRHVLLIVFLTILGIAGGVGSYILLQKYNPKYTAKTYFEVLSPLDIDITAIGGGSQVAEKLMYNRRASMAFRIKQQQNLDDLLSNPDIQDTSWFRSFGSKSQKDEARKKAMKDLKKNLSANAVRDGFDVVISMTCSKAEDAAKIANETMNSWVLSQGSIERSEVNDKLAALRDRQKSVKGELSSIERLLDNNREEIRVKYGIADLEARQYADTFTIQLNSLELESNKLSLEIRELESIIETLNKYASTPIDELDQVIANLTETDSTMISLTQRLAFLEAELAGRRTKFGDNHRVVRQTMELIKSTEQERDLRRAFIAEQTRQSNLNTARNRLVELLGKQEQMARLRDEALTEKEAFDLARVEYERLSTDKEERESTLNDIKASIEKYQIMLDTPETAKVMAGPMASVPQELSSPQLIICVPGGTMLGLMLGVGLAFLIELLNDLVRTPRDVIRHLRIPLLGVIPDAREDRKLRKVDLAYVVNKAPNSMISESYRRLRTNFKLSDAGASTKVLLVTGGMAGDGSTSVAVNLATTMAAEHKNILVIDANLRRPSLNRIFAVSQPDGTEVASAGFGLTDVLTGGCRYEDAVRATAIEGLSVMDSGRITSNPTELLGSSRMKQLIDQCREHYDNIIIDGPPVLLVSDAKILASFADGTILVFNASATRRGVAQRTIRELREVNVNVLGCTLFAVQAMKGGYFHEQFKFYQEYQKLQLAQTG